MLQIVPLVGYLILEAVRLDKGGQEAGKTAGCVVDGVPLPPAARPPCEAQAAVSALPSPIVEFKLPTDPERLNKLRQESWQSKDCDGEGLEGPCIRSTIKLPWTAWTAVGMLSASSM